MAQDMCFDDGSALQALHDQVYAGPGVTGIEPAAAALSALAPWISSSSQRLRDALRRGGVSWSGHAAQAANSAVQRGGEWADTAGQATHTAAASVQAFSDSFAQMKPKIVTPQPVPTLTAWDAALGVLSPSTEDHARIVEQNLNATETALAAYTAHQASTNDGLGHIQMLDPAPSITNPAAAPPTPPVSDTRAGGAPHATTPHTGRGGVGVSAGAAGATASPRGTGNSGPVHGGHVPAPARSATVPGGTTPSGWAPPAPREPMDPTSLNGAHVPSNGLSGGLPPGGVFSPGGVLGVGAGPVSPDSGPAYRLPSGGSRAPQKPPERTRTGVPDPAQNSALTGHLDGPGSGKDVGPGGPGTARPPLPPPLGGGAGTRHRARSHHRRNDTEVPVYDDLFGIDDLIEGIAPPVIGIEWPQP